MDARFMAGGLLHKPHSLAGENQKPVRNSLKSSNLGYEPPSAHDWASSLPNHLNGYPDSFQPILMDLVGENADSIGVTLLSVGDAVVTATAYGSDLTTVLDSVSVSNPGTGVGWYNKDRITLTGPGIARVRFEITTPRSFKLALVAKCPPQSRKCPRIWGFDGFWRRSQGSLARNGRLRSADTLM
jgi:hypothetical protein